MTETITDSANQIVPTVVMPAPMPTEQAAPRRKMGRPKGSTKAAKQAKVSAMLAAIPSFTMSPIQILECKVELLKLLSEGTAKNITEACRMLGISPTKVYSWAKSDHDFKALIDACYEVVADEIETEFIAQKNFIPKMMMLKGIRPKYRENFKVEYDTNKLEEFIKELKSVSNPQPTITDGVV